MRRDWRQIEWGTETIEATRRLMVVAATEDLGSCGDLTSAATVSVDRLGAVDGASGMPKTPHVISSAAQAELAFASV